MGMNRQGLDERQGKGKSCAGLFSGPFSFLLQILISESETKVCQKNVDNLVEKLWKSNCFFA
jgi:hypothetical protein